MLTFITINTIDIQSLYALSPPTLVLILALEGKDMKAGHARPLLRNLYTGG